MKKKRSYALRVVCIIIIALVGMGPFFQWKYFTRSCQNISGNEGHNKGVVKSIPNRKNEKWVIDIASPALGDSSWCRTRVYSNEDISDLEFNQEILFHGDLRYPEPFDGFDYPGYLKTRGIHYVMYDGVINTVNERCTSLTFQGAILHVRSIMSHRILSSMSSPNADVLLALMLGIRTSIPEDITMSFSRSGASHILAISGLHITLLATNCASLLLKCGVPRRYVSIFISTIIVLYVILIGAPASAVRAGSMSVLIILVRSLGITGNGLNVLFVVAAVMAVLNPYIVLYDISYQLSIAATFGILVFGRRFEHYCSTYHLPRSFGVRAGVAMSCAASMTTWPLLLYHFHQFSFLSIISTMIIVPILPLVFFSGIIVIVCGRTCSIVSWTMVEYMIHVTEWLQQFDFFIVSF